MRCEPDEADFDFFHVFVSDDDGVTWREELNDIASTTRGEPEIIDQAAGCPRCGGELIIEPG